MPSTHLRNVLAAALVGGAVLLPATPAEAARTCFGKRATIVGTNTNPRRPVEIHGTRGDDVIVGLRGWDEIDGRGGDDLICSGRGDDHVTAGGGNDQIRLGGGIDFADGGKGDDRLYGGPGPADGLLGGAGNDRLLGGPGGDDSLVGGAGNDHLDGGGGYDIAEFWTATRGVAADLRTGIATGDGRDDMVAVEGLIGSRFDDLLLGNELSNHIRGGGGSDDIQAFGSNDGGYDLLRSDGGGDSLDGGDGWDMVSYNLQPVSVEADLTTGVATSADGFGRDSLAGIEYLTGSKYDDVLVGDAGDNAIIGNWGNDLIDGAGGSDEVAYFDAPVPVVADMAAGIALVEGWGDDTFTNFENLSGSAYADVLTGDGSANLIWGGPGGDSMRGLAGDDELVGHGGVDDADGGDGTDACEAETETNCENDPMPEAGLHRQSTAPLRNPRWSSL
ncbi:MAG: hypothetical protein M3279_03685 [Actinomycetota bacterium]|nr:hypothetical protein [Actinomycetota bacterium]